MATSYLFSTIASAPATQYGQAMSAFAGLLTGAGWTIQGSGDGAGGTFSGSGNIFSGTGAGAGGWSNANAWIRLRDPSGVREFVLQHDNAGGAKIRYSPFAKFLGVGLGAVAATIPPTATDEKYLRGAVASFGAAWFASGTNNFYGTAKDVAPYGFWFAASASSAMKTGLMFDPVTSVAEDPDPYVIHVGSTNAYAVNTSSLGRLGSSTATWSVSGVTFGGTTEGCFAVMSADRSLFYYVQPAGYVVLATGGTGAANNIINSGGLAVNPFNGKQDPFPFFYCRSQQTNSTVAPGMKGWSTLGRWTTTAKTNLVDTLDTKNWVCVGSMWLPWDGTTTPIG